MRTALALLMVFTVPAAQAACPQELAVYSDADKSLTVEFSPNAGEMATVSNRFRASMENDVVLDGIVQWTQGLARPYGMMMHQCPEGDVTGDELDACTIWEGIIYSVAEDGTVGLMPSEGEEAAAALLFSDLAGSVRYSKLYTEGKISVVPWDVMTLSGCQE